MKTALLAISLMTLVGCSMVHTGYVTKDNDGVMYERHYLMFTLESKCSGSCEQHVKDIHKKYYEKHHK